MRIWRAGTVATLSAMIAALGAAACNGILGISDVDVSGAEGGSSSGGDGSKPGDDGGTLPDGAKIDSGPGATVSGAVHFLQEGGSVTLASGADSVTVTKNGAFDLFLPAPITGDYDIKVTKNPAGQSCWVVNGTGSKASPTPGLEVRCTVVRSTIGKRTDQIAMRSAVYAQFDDLDDVVFTNDIPAQTMIVLSVPSVRGIDKDYPMYRIGVLIDNVLEAESVGRVEEGAPVNTPVVVMHLPVLPPAKHTVRPVWKKVDGSNPQGIQRDIFREHIWGPGSEVRPELDVVVLDSLSTFDKVVSTELTTTKNYAPLGSDVSAGIPDLVLNNSAKQWGLLTANIPDLSGEAIVKLLLDGAEVAGQRKFTNAPNTNKLLTYQPTIFRELEPGPHTVTSTVRGLATNACTYGTSAGESGLPVNAKKPAALRALLWKPGAKAGAFDSVGRIDVTPPSPSEAVVVPGSAIEINVDRPSKALVVLDIQQLNSELAFENSPISEGAVWVNDKRGPGAAVGRQGFDDGLRSNVFTRYGIVDLLPGKSTIDVRLRNDRGFPMYTLGGVRMGAVVLE